MVLHSSRSFALLVVACLTGTVAETQAQTPPSQTQAQTQPSRTPAQSSRPNILVIWGDDIGQSNVSAYTKGLVGYRTPNIDRIADEA